MNGHGVGASGGLSVASGGLVIQAILSYMKAMPAERQSAAYRVAQRERDVLAGVVGGFIAAAAAGTGIVPALAIGVATGTLVGLLEKTKKKSCT
jgi:hypothetical protein